MEGLELIEFTPPSCFALVNCTTGQVDYVLNGTSNGVILSEHVNQYVGQIVIGSDTFYGCWNIQVSFGCEGFRSDVGIYDIVAAENLTNYCGCPTGYQLVDGECVATLTVTPTQNGTPLDCVVGQRNDDHGGKGTVFFNITGFTYPIQATLSGTYIPNPFASFGVGGTFIDANNNTVPLNAWVDSLSPYPFWGPDSTAPEDGRLDTVGVWIPTSQITEEICGQWIGFSQCLILPTSGTYSIGIAGDNRVRIKIDGQEVIKIETGGYTYRTWNIFEITLTAGTHIIELEGYNNPTPGVLCKDNPAIFGAEIYSVGIAALQAITNQGDLDLVTVFTTKDLQDTGTFQISQTNGLSCPPGYALNLCGDPVCTLINTVPYLECCYQLISCETQDVEYQFTYAGETLLPGVPNPGSIVAPTVISSITVGTDTLTGCWTVQKTNTGACTGPVTTYSWANVTHVDTLTDCNTCLPSCYLIEDCKAEQPALIVTNAIFGTFIGKTVGFEIIGPVTGSWPVGSYCANVIDSTKTCDDAILINIDNTTVTGYLDCLKCSPPCYLLTDCSDANNTLVLSGDLSGYIGDIVTLAGCGDTCWIVEYADNCEGSIPAPPVISSFPSTGNPADRCCYKYGKPSSFAGSITINGNVIPLFSTNLIDLVNEITGLGFGTCTISDPGDLSGFGAVICIVGNNTYGPLTFNAGTATASQYCQYDSVLKQCDYTSYEIFFGITVFINITINGVSHTSIATPTTTGFEIIDYLNSLGLGTFSISFSGLTPPISATITVEGVNNYGAIVITNAFTGIPITTLTIDECTNYVNTQSGCTACNPPPTPIIPDPVKPRAVKPGYKTPACSPEYTEKVNCTFGEAYYNIMLANRYGLDNCCDIDVQKWSIKKAWLDLEEKKDPEFQCNNTPVCPSCKNASCCCQNPNDCIN